MEVRLTPDLTHLREILDGRYDEIKSGRVKPIDGEDAFARLREKSKERRSSARLRRPSLAKLTPS
jgi:hypothetical protein